MSRGPTINPATGMLTLERRQDGWQIADSAVEIDRPVRSGSPDHSWVIRVSIVSGESDARAWLARHDLHCASFPRMRDALRALTAAHMLDPIPAGQASLPALRRLDEGRWETPDGLFAVTRHGRTYEIAHTRTGRQAYARGTLRNAARLLGDMRDLLS